RDAAGAAGYFWIESAADPLYGGATAAGRPGPAGAGGEVWRARSAGFGGNSLPDFRGHDAGSRAHSANGREAGGGYRAGPGIRPDYGLPGAIGGASTTTENPHWRRRDGRQPRHSHGAAAAGGPRAGCRGNLEGCF